MRVKVDEKYLEETGYASEKILLDTNLLVYAHNKSSPQYSKASCVLLSSINGLMRGYISNQSLMEFYSVMTNPRKIKPAASPEDVRQICNDFLQSGKLKKIFAGEDAAREALQIAAGRKMRGPEIFDCLLAVTARQNEIDKIWTDNISDFKRFEEFIAVENPLSKDWELLTEE